MDDYGYHQHHALQPYQLSNHTLALPSALSVDCNPNVSFGLFSEGLLPAFDQFEYDSFMVPSDQQGFHSMMVNEGFDQFDPLYSSLDIPTHDHSLSANAMQVVTGRPSFDSTESSESFGSPLLWNDALVTNGLDTGVTLLHHQMHQPVQVVTDIDSKECKTIQLGQGEVKTEPGQSGRPKRTRKGSARQMSETDRNLNNSVADSLTWGILSQYFYMPIAQAARELNIGLTLFKKRCRELGVRRWPHRKLMSIQSLIKNVKEMEKNGGVDPTLSKGTIRNALEVLENQRKLMEVMPDTELEAQTKRLRQACFKANYKKRRLMIMNGGGTDDSRGSTNSTQGNEGFDIASSVNNNSSSGKDLEESEELKSLLFDALSPSECSFLNGYM